MKQTETVIEYLQKKYNKMVLNQSQAAAEIGVEPSTMGKWRKDEVGPRFKKMPGGKGRVLYPVVEIAKFLENDLIETA
jgi:DNA-binding XRE family transcriptional regulator